MSPENSSGDRDPVERLAEEFVARHRRGDGPSPAEYAERHPQWADRIHALFPALLLMERHKPGVSDLSAPPEDAGAGPRRWSSWGTTGSSGRSAAAAWGSSTRPSRNRSAATWP